MDGLLQIVTLNEGGGAQKIAYQLHNSSDNNILIFLYDKNTYYKGKGVVNLLPSKPRNILDYLVMLYRLFFAFLGHDTKKVITHSHYSNIIGSFYAFIFAISSRVSVHHGFISNQNFMVIALDKFFGIIGIYKNIVCVSGSVSEKLSSYPEDYLRKIRVIFNAVDMSNYEKIFLKREKFTLFSSGRLHKNKNYFFLISLLSKLSFDFEFRLAGEGSEYSNLKKLALEQGIDVKFLGFLSSTEVYNEIQGCDVFVFPSRDETFGLSPLEAAYFNKGIVCSDIPALREVLEGWAVFCPYDSEFKWLNALEHIYAQGFPHAAGKNIDTFFDVERMISEYANL